MTELKQLGFVALLALVGLIVLFVANGKTTGMVWYQEVKCPEVYPNPNQSTVECQEEVLRLCNAITPAWPTIQSRYEPCWRSCVDQGWRACENKFMEE